MRSRRLPSGHVQADVLIEQDNRCLYCGHRFGDLVVRRGGELRWLELNWDHFVPFAYSNRNPDDNWVAACDLCNGYKSDLIFEDVASVRAHILDMAVKHEHDPLPFWHTDSPVLAPAASASGSRPADESALDAAPLPRLATPEESDASDDDGAYVAPVASAPRAPRRGADFVAAAMAIQNSEGASVEEWLALHGER